MKESLTMQRSSLGDYKLLSSRSLCAQLAGCRAHRIRRETIHKPMWPIHGPHSMQPQVSQHHQIHALPSQSSRRPVECRHALWTATWWCACHATSSIKLRQARLAIVLYKRRAVPAPWTPLQRGGCTGTSKPARTSIAPRLLSHRSYMNPSS